MPSHGFVAENPAILVPGADEMNQRSDELVFIILIVRGVRSQSAFKEFAI